MPSLTPREKAEAFRALHQGPRLFVLPNAWDVATARLLEDAGFPAIATTSAGIAWALGYPDGERISRGEMLAAIRRSVGALRVPVTAVVEGGYGATVAAAAETARGAIAAGAVGLHLEAGTNEGTLLDPELQAARNAAPLDAPRPELERLGVRRASLGRRLVQATLGVVRRLATELRERGTYDTMTELLIPFGEVQRLVGRTPRPIRTRGYIYTVP